MPDVTPVTTQVEAVIVTAVELIAPKPILRWRALIFQAYMLMTVVALGVLLISASMFNYFSFDLAVTSAVQTINVAWFASLMWWVSMIGYAPQIYILVASIAILLFVIGLKWEAVTALMTAASGASLAALIKIAIHRPRPGANLVNVLHQLDSYSFPSGHVLTYTVFFWFSVFPELYTAQCFICTYCFAYDLGKPCFVDWDFPNLCWRSLGQRCDRCLFAREPLAGV
jgi:hypothetical protein